MFHLFGGTFGKITIFALNQITMQYDYLPL